MLFSHELDSTRAKYTATTFYILYHTSRKKQKAINLNLGGRCGQTEIVCHWSLLMSLELAEQSIQLLTCHISRWGLCHHSPQDNQSKSWKKCDLCLFCHWSFLMPLAPAGQSIQLTLSSFTARQPIQILGKGVTSGVVVTEDGVYDTWDQFIAGVHKAGNIF